MLSIIHMYTIVLHIALPSVLFFLHRQDQPSVAAPSWAELARDPLVVGAAAVAALAVVLAMKIPRALVAAGKDASTAYIVRMCMLELCVVAGFVVGLLRQAPELCVPFAAVGLALVLMSGPTPDNLAALKAE